MGNKEVEYNYCIFTFVNENHESIIENKKNTGYNRCWWTIGGSNPGPTD